MSTLFYRWKSKCDGLEQKYKPYQDQIDTLMELNSGLMGQTELAQSEVKLCVASSSLEY